MAEACKGFGPTAKSKSRALVGCTRVREGSVSGEGGTRTKDEVEAVGEEGSWDRGGVALNLKPLTLRDNPSICKDKSHLSCSLMQVALKP